MNVLWGSNAVNPVIHDQLCQWASLKIFGHDRGFGPCTTMGVFEGEVLVGVMVYHDFNREAGVLEISGAADRKEWLKRHVLWELFSYPFDQLGCQMVAMRVSERNRQWNGRGLPRLLTAYGFQSVLIPRLYGRTEDGIVYTLTDDDWRSNGFHRQHRKCLPASRPSGQSEAA